jgi:hypothetical protein
MKLMLAAVFAACWLAAPIADAAGNDELWEITSQMNMPGMPTGMGASKQQVCMDKDPKKAATQHGDMQQCKVTDAKQSGSRSTMTLSCPDGTTVIEQTYNAARTEYKGTIKMKTRDGEMVVNSSGRKIGSCDAQEARRQHEAQSAAMQAKGKQALADAEAHRVASEEKELKQCASAVDTMQVQRLGLYETCNTNRALCDQMASSEHTKRVATACIAHAAEYCKRYQTMQGFLRANGDERGARMCNLSREQVRASHCPEAAQKEHLPYLVRFCPAEAKPIAQQHCVGRTFTASEARDKYTDFCRSYLANASLEERTAADSGAASGRPAAAKKDAVSETISEGVNQGLNKLRGLFGR